MMIPQARFIRKVGAVAAGAVALPGRVLAHASEGGFVLLLPTDVYIFAGVAAVALTVVLLVFMRDDVMPRLFASRTFWRTARSGAPLVCSLGSFGFLAWLVHVGLNGPRDPLANPLPLTIWTVWWICIVLIQGLVGDIWRWLNPWTGPLTVARNLLNIRTFLRYPRWLGHSGALLSFLAFAAILLADPAPSDPARLAQYVVAYWLMTFLAALAFGPRWMLRAEGLSVLMRAYALLGVFGRRAGQVRAGLPGWQVFAMRKPPLLLAVFILVLLGSGSFDGLNETFWWLDLIGMNPLEFPGRSAVIGQNLIGLIVANTALIGAFAVAVWLGLRIGDVHMPLPEALCRFAPTILPIALGYHFAHYLTSVLVDGQYVIAAATDPWAVGADYLGLGTFYVTTGFFNTQDSVRVLWLSQAGAVVLGHILAVILAHAVAVRQFGSQHRAALSQAPLAMFMIFYTFFGLWLLASPRGF